MDLKKAGKALGGVLLGIMGAGAGAVSAVIGVKYCTQCADDVFEALFSEDEDMDIDIDTSVINEEED